MRQILQNLPDNYKSIAKNTSLLFGVRISQKLLGLAAMYFVVRAIDQEMFGQYQFILSIIAFFSFFALPGVNNAIMQSVARGHLGTYRLLLPYSFAGSVLGALVLLVMAGWYYRIGHNYEMVVGFFLAATLFPFSRGLIQWRAMKAGTENFSALVIWEGGAAILTQIMVITGVLIFPGTFLVPLLFVLAVPAVQDLFLTGRTYRQVESDASVEQGSLSYGLKTSFYALPAMLAQHIEKFLLFFFFSPAVLALFVAAEKIPDMTKNLIQDFATVLAPRLARHKNYTARLDRVFKWIALAAAVSIVLVAFTILPWFFVLLFGETYEEAVPYASALMCSVAVGNAAMLHTRFIRSQMDAHSVRDIYLVFACVKIATAAVLVPLYGLPGAVISVFLTRIVSVVTVHFIIQKRYPIHPAT